MSEDLPAIIPTTIAIMGLTFLPFLVVMGTAFTKFSIVLMLLRNALGVQQAPSGMVINSIALTLTAFIMVPVGDSILRELQQQNVTLSDWNSAVRVFDLMSRNMSGYLSRFANERELEFFMDAARAIWPETMHGYITADNIFLLLPAHVTSEITRAFEIAFLLFLPFVVVDMIVSIS